MKYLILIIGYLLVIFLHSCNSGVKISKEFYENGSIKSESTFKVDLLDGKQILYHENGKIKEIKYWSSGNPVDSVKLFDEMGKLTQKGCYVNNKLRLYNSEGVLLLESEYKGAVVDGIMKTYYKNGGLKSITEYDKGEKFNVQLFFYTDST